MQLPCCDSLRLRDHRRWRVGGLDHELARRLIPQQEIHRGLPLLLRFTTAHQEYAACRPRVVDISRLV